MILEKVVSFFRRKVEESKPIEKVEIDYDSIYVQLSLAIGKLNEVGISIPIGSSRLGTIQSFASNLHELKMSIVEVNEILKRKEHIKSGLFWTKHLMKVRLDELLFVQDGYYIDNVAETIGEVIEQIVIYKDLMKNADQAKYGVDEHNHRQLYAYTQSLTNFINALLEHFGH